MGPADPRSTNQLHTSLPHIVPTAFLYQTEVTMMARVFKLSKILEFDQWNVAE